MTSLDSEQLVQITGGQLGKLSIGISGPSIGLGNGLSVNTMTGAIQQSLGFGLTREITPKGRIDFQTPLFR